MKPGDRVEIHPRHDLWMMGARFGTILRIRGSLATVQLDKVQRPKRFPLADLTKVGRE